MNRLARRAVVWAGVFGVLGGTAAAQPPADASRTLAGTWLVESASWESGRGIVRAVAVFTETGFTLTGFRGSPTPWTGTYSIASDRELDLHAGPHDIGSPGGTSLLVPATDLHAIYKRETAGGVDRLTVCFPMHTGGERPATFDEPQGAADPRVVRFVRADAAFAGFADDVTVRVLRPDGTPAAGARVFDRMDYGPALVGRADGSFVVDDSRPPAWSYAGVEGRTADANGLVRLRLADFEGPTGVPIGVRDDEHGWVGLIEPSAALLRRGAFTVRLRPTRKVTGTIRPDAEMPFFRPTVQIGPATFIGTDGRFDIPLPPGDYAMSANGQDLVTFRRRVSVPEADGDVSLGTLSAHVSEGLSLVGKPAPALDGVVAWKNGPADLAGLKGNVVLLNFWGYWCGGCVNEMPTLFHLHDKYASRGLVVVSVHLDAGGEVDTVAKLDARTARYRDGWWLGRDVPFPTALASGEPFGRSRSRAGAAYGVIGYPTTVVIGRDGRVIGSVVGTPKADALLDLGSDAAAEASVEKLLASK